MARVTVEDCIEQVPNRFDLVLVAAQRARQLAAGSPLTLERNNDKNPVVALREIAETTVSTAALEEHLIESHQKHAVGDEPEEEYLELLSEEQSFAGVIHNELEIQNLEVDDELEELDEDIEIPDEDLEAEEA